MEIPRSEPRKCVGCGAVVVLWNASLCKGCYVELKFDADELMKEAA